MSLKQRLKDEKRYAVGMSLPKARNLSALSPLLKKGGVHDKDNPKTRYKKDRQAIKRQLRLSHGDMASI